MTTTAVKPPKKLPEVADKHLIKVNVKQKVNSFSPPLKYKILADEEIRFTKAKAYEFLELRTFEGERPVRERHVQFLFDEYAAGRFLWQNVLLASAKLPNGDEYRINGQHTCWMRVHVQEKDEPLNAVVRAMSYSVNDEHQLRQLYSAFDRGAPRTVGHVGKVLLMGTKVVDGIPSSLINQVLAGFKIHFSSDAAKRNATSIEDWCSIIENNHATNFNVVGRYTAQHERDVRWVKRASVIAAMLSTFEKNVEASDNFWAPVLNGLGLDKKNDPRYQLRKYLQEHGNTTHGGMIPTSSEEMYSVCIQMWNHFRDGTSITVVKPPIERPRVKS